MRKRNFNYIVCIILMFSLFFTFITGLIQVRLDLHRFLPHKYLAYFTVFLTSIHIFINFDKIKKFIKRK
jgi:hypothetical protein